MKQEYKNRAIENLVGIDKKVTIIQEMLEGKRPANEKEATDLTKEIKKIIEITTNLIDLN